MEVRIGVVYTARELTVETDESVDGLTSAIESAMSKGDSLLWLRLCGSARQSENRQADE